MNFGATGDEVDGGAVAAARTFDATPPARCTQPPSASALLPLLLIAGFSTP